MTQEDRLVALANQFGWTVVSNGGRPVRQVQFVREAMLLTADFREGMATYGQLWTGDTLRLTYNYSVFNTIRLWLRNPSAL